MDLMLSLSRHCSLGGGLAQWSAPGCVAGWVCGRDVGAAGEGAEVERRRRGRGREVGGEGGGEVEGGRFVHQKTCTRVQT